MTGRGWAGDPPARTTYGYLAFAVSDPDGYRLIFYEPLAGTPEAVARQPRPT